MFNFWRKIFNKKEKKVNNKIRIFYLPSSRNDYVKPEVTIVTREVKGSIEAAFAVCSLGDMFCKKTGREIAIKRLNDANTNEGKPFNLDSIESVEKILAAWHNAFAPVSADTEIDLYALYYKLNSEK